MRNNPRINLALVANACDPCAGSRILRRNMCPACDLKIEVRHSIAYFNHVSNVLFHENCVVLFGADHCKAIAEATNS